MATLASWSSERQTKRDPRAELNLLLEYENCFNLAHALQMSLDLNKTLETFFTQTQFYVPSSSMKYLFDDQKISLELGKPKRHSISYKLINDGFALGDIRVSRSTKFSEDELSILETLLGVLFFPLRNALLYREAVQSSLCDSLTEIGNRKALNCSFEREIKFAKRHGQALSILLIDVDHFKAVNDNVGHRNGDKTLVQIVQTIQGTLRETDQIFRYGGEEFLIILNDTDSLDAVLIANRIRANVASSPILLDKQRIFCTISTGISTYNGDTHWEALIEQADRALYKSKAEGRNRVETWSDISAMKNTNTSKTKPGD